MDGEETSTTSQGCIGIVQRQCTEGKDEEEGEGIERVVDGQVNAMQCGRALVGTVPGTAAVRF